MGSVFWGLHSPIAAGLIRSQGITQAFETGTYFGSGALQLASLVQRVWTVEADPELYKFCEATYGSISSVNFLTGDSAVRLREFAQTCDFPTLFVLDAHWFPTSPRRGYKAGNLYPVLDELEALRTVSTDALASSAVIVDDARFLLGSLPLPFVRPAIPSITEVLSRVESLFECVSVTDDLIVGSNTFGKQAIEEYLAWRDLLEFPPLGASARSGTW